MTNEQRIKNLGKYTKKGNLPWNKGVPCSEETKKKLSLVNSGKSNPHAGVPWTEESKLKLSKTEKGHFVSEETKSKIRLVRGKNHPNYGKKRTLESRIKQGQSIKGEKSRLWKGGITEENHKIRSGIETRLWREAVFARDNWTCQKYGIKGGKLHSHHIQNFAQYIELRFAIDNGITLSEKAHKEFHKKYGTKDNSHEQLLEFINK